MITHEQCGLSIRTGSRFLRLEAWGPDVVRVRETPNPTFAEVPNALVASGPTDAQIDLRDDGASLRTGALTVTVSPYGRLQFYRKGSPEPRFSDVDWNPGAPQLHPISREFRPVEQDLYHIEANFLAYDDERFFGLGQHRHGLLDQKGAIIDLFQRNAEVAIPFLVSSRGYGLLWNNPAVGRVELGADRTRWVAEASRQLDYLVIVPPAEPAVAAESTYAAIMRRYADLTGHAPQMPEWATGFWQCKLRYADQDELLDVAREHKRRGLPMSVIVVDFFHWKQQGDWSFDPEHWPDPEAMIRELSQMGIRLMVSVWPTVNPKSENAALMRRDGHLLKGRHGEYVVFPFIDTNETPPVLVNYYDPTNPAAREFVWRQCKQNYWDKGVALFWLDACEPELYPIDHANLSFHAGGGSEVSGVYPLMHECGFYEGMTAAGAESVINLCRSAWAGSQRYGAAVWSGDIRSDWETLRKQIAAGLNMGMSGIPWWTTDIGGFYGGDINDPGFRELLIRWFEFGVFCPICRLHGNRDPRPESHLVSGAANEVWSYGGEVYEVLRELLFLRERLRPYLHEQMRIASETGVPPMRPLFFDYPDDQESYRIADEFLLGPDIIAAPVTEPGACSRAVYVPRDGNWTDGWTGKRLPAGQWVSLDAPLERIPVLVRECTDVALYG
jgi:alpha-D-xyloside xylohydrolase